MRIRRFAINESTSMMRIQTILLGFAMAIGLTIRLENLGENNLWIDELRRSSWYLSDNVKFAVTSENCSCFGVQSLVIWSFQYLLPDEVFYLRIPLVIFSTLTIGVVFLIGKELGSIFAGLLSATLLSLSPLSIVYATEVSHYPMFEFLSSLFILLTVRILIDSERNFIEGVSWPIVGVIIAENETFMPVLIFSILAVFYKIWKGASEGGADQLIGRLKILMSDRYFRYSLWPIAISGYGITMQILNPIGVGVGRGPSISSIDDFLIMIAYWNQDLLDFSRMILLLGIILSPIAFVKFRKEGRLDQILVVISAAALPVVMILVALFIGKGGVSARYFIHSNPMMILSASIIIVVFLEYVGEIAIKKVPHYSGYIGRTIPNLVCIFFLVSYLLVINSNMEEWAPHRERTDYISPLNDIESYGGVVPIVSAPGAENWQLAAELNGIQIPEIDLSDWELKNTGFDKCEFVSENEFVLILVSEQHHDYIDSTGVSGPWEVIDSKHYFRSSWFELTRSTNWEGECI